MNDTSILTPNARTILAFLYMAQILALVVEIYPCQSAAFCFEHCRLPPTFINFHNIFKERLVTVMHLLL